MISKRANILWLFVPDLVAVSIGIFGWLFVRGIGQFAESMEGNVSDDPVYKKNLQRLIERNREFEEAKE